MLLYVLNRLAPALLLFFAATNCANAENWIISNYGTWDQSTNANKWGTGNNITQNYGILFGYPIVSSPYNYVKLIDFSLYFKLLSASPQNYIFSIYNWNGYSRVPYGDQLSTNPPPTPLFTTGILTAPSSTSSFTKVTYDTGMLNLDRGKQYLATISTLNISNSDGYYGLGATLSDQTGNNLVYTNSNDISGAPWTISTAKLIFETTAISN